jgi:hypothetical protein
MPCLEGACSLAEFGNAELEHFTGVLLRNVTERLLRELYIQVVPELN